MTKKRCLQNFYILGNSDSNGYLPMSATLVSEEIYKSFPSLKSYFPHGFTHSTHPVCTAVAPVNSEIIVKKKLIEKAARCGIYLKSRLIELIDKPPILKARFAKEFVFARIKFLYP